MGTIDSKRQREFGTEEFVLILTRLFLRSALEAAWHGNGKSWQNEIARKQLGGSPSPVCMTVGKAFFIN